MSLIGFSFRSVNAYSKDVATKEKIDIGMLPPTIESIEKKDLSSIGIKEAIQVDFKFSLNYTHGIGEITLGGEVIYKVDDAKKIVAGWKDGKLDEHILTEILNIIFRRCMVKSVEISDFLRLPSPVIFPEITPTNKVTDAKGETDGS